MDLISAFILIIFSLVVISIKPNRWSNFIFYFVTLIIGLFTLTEGITFSGSTYIIAQSTLAFLLFIIMVFGSVMGFLTALVSKEE